MKHISPLRILIISAALLAFGVWLWYPSLKQDRLIGVTDVQEQALSSLSFAKEYAILQGIDLDQPETDLGRYELIRPYVIFKGQKSPTKTEIIAATGFTDFVVGGSRSPVLGEKIKLVNQ